MRGLIHTHKRWKAYSASVQSLHTSARYWEGAMAKKPLGVFSLLAAAVTGFSTHLAKLCATAWSRVRRQ